jgi:hypothetical protein
MLTAAQYRAKAVEYAHLLKLAITEGWNEASAFLQTTRSG